LVRLYESVLAHPGLAGMVIGTRPDCLPEALLDWLAEAARSKPIYIELGIESFCDETLARMNRGHTYATARDAVQRVAQRGLPVGGHFLVGFPGEPWTGFFDAVDELNQLPLHSVKVHQLHIFKQTPLARLYREHPEEFVFPSKEAYFGKLAFWLRHLRPDLYVDRLFGDAPLKYILNPVWGLRLDLLIREFDAYLAGQGVRQGALYTP